MSVIIVNIVFIIFGIYLFFMASKMKQTGKLNPNLLSQQDINRCKDVKGYISFVVPKMQIFAAAIVLVGVIGIGEHYIDALRNYRFVTLIVFLITFFVYLNQMRLAKNKYMY